MAESGSRDPEVDKENTWRPESLRSCAAGEPEAPPRFNGEPGEEIKEEKTVPLHSTFTVILPRPWKTSNSDERPGDYLSASAESLRRPAPPSDAQIFPETSISPFAIWKADEELRGSRTRPEGALKFAHVRRPRGRRSNGKSRLLSAHETLEISSVDRFELVSS